MNDLTADAHGHGQESGSFTRLGGALGIAACSIGMLLFLAACFGFNVFFALGFLPTVMSLVGMVLSVIGGARKEGNPDDNSALAGVFINLMGLVGGIFLMALWYDWPIFYRAPSAM